MSKHLPALAGVLMVCTVVGFAQTRLSDAALDVKSLEAALSAKPQGADADRLADRIRAMFGGRDALMRGAAPKTDETTVAWALELTEPPTTGVTTPTVSRDVGNLNMAMVRVGSTNVYALVR